MPEPLTPVLLVVGGVVAGATLAVVFFGGLELTTRRLAETSRPALLAAASLTGRLILLAGSLVGLALLSPVALLAGVVGLLGVRTAFVRRRRVPDTESRASAT